MMSDNDIPIDPDGDPMAGLRARAEALEDRLAEAEQEPRSRLPRAELKVEAVRAGMVDLDGLKLLDLDQVQVNSDGEIENAAQLMAQFRRAKPWLFGGTSSSSSANAPPAQPQRHKLATEMSDKEYRTARAAILKLHTLTPLAASVAPYELFTSITLKESLNGHSKLSYCLAADHSAGLSRARIPAGIGIAHRLSRVCRPRADSSRHW
jgi:hypothetical protein